MLIERLVYERKRVAVIVPKSTREAMWKAFQYTCEGLLLKLSAAHRTLDERRYEKWRNANSLWLHEIEKHMAERYDHPFDADDVEEEDLLSSFTDRGFSLDKRLFKVKEIVADIRTGYEPSCHFPWHPPWTFGSLRHEGANPLGSA